MIDVLPVISMISAVIIFLGLVLLFSTSKKTDKPAKKKKKSHFKGKDRNSIIKEATRKLSQNPKDAEALLAIAEIYYSEGDFEKAMRSYEILEGLCATNPDLDELDITLKFGLAAMQLKKYDIAYKRLAIARTMNNEIFEVNFNLGLLEYMKKDYDKAVILFLIARKIQPEHVPTMKFLGLSMFFQKKYKEALGLLKRTMDYEPDDKETLFAMAECFFEIGQSEQAVRIFAHLRPDPVYGPKAALFSGAIRMQTRQYPKAIMDYEIGLRHKNIPGDINLELKYNLANAYLKQQEIGQALNILFEIKALQPNYKDTEGLINRYKELNTNKHLQIFLLAPKSDFVVLCRKIAVAFFPAARVKIVDIAVTENSSADILVEVSTSKWEDIILFRFLRTTGQVGELVLRDLYSRLKEVRAGRGFCITAGSFSDTAKQFVEARLIDLVPKAELMNYLDKMK